jgi:MFS family permease
VLELSWVYACYLVTMGVGVVLVGKLADKKGYVKLLLLGSVIGVVGTFSYLFVYSMYSLLFVQILMGAATALREPSWYALYDQYSGDGDHDGAVWGLAAGLWYVCQGVALMLGALIVSRYSFDMLFIAMGTVLTLSTLYQAQILKYQVQ